MRRVLMVLVGALFAVGLLAGVAGAGNTPTGTLTPLNSDLHYGDVAAFDVTFSGKSTMHDRVYVWLDCTQTELVLRSWVWVGSPEGYEVDFHLEITNPLIAPVNEWTSGAADCVATLQREKGGTVTVLDTVAFHVAA